MSQNVPGTRQIQLDLNEMKKNKFFIATPCYGGQLMEPYFRSVIKMMTFFNGHQIPLAFGTIANESLVTRARNVLVAYFLNSDYTHLLFIDADIEFKPSDFLSLIAADKPVIAGVYPQKRINWEMVHKAARAGEPPEKLAEYSGTLIVQFLERLEAQVVPLTEPFSVKSAGTGFMCIKREVLEALSPHVNKFREIDTDGDRQVNEFFFIRNDSNETQMSEDVAFCWLCRKHDIPIFIAPWVELGHMGTYTFRGSPVIVEVQK